MHVKKKKKKHEPIAHTGVSKICVMGDERRDGWKDCDARGAFLSGAIRPIPVNRPCSVFHQWAKAQPV